MCGNLTLMSDVDSHDRQNAYCQNHTRTNVWLEQAISDVTAVFLSVWNVAILNSSLKVRGVAHPNRSRRWKGLLRSASAPFWWRLDHFNQGGRELISLVLVVEYHSVFIFYRTFPKISENPAGNEETLKHTERVARCADLGDSSKFRNESSEGWCDEVVHNSLWAWEHSIHKDMGVRTCRLCLQ